MKFLGFTSFLAIAAQVALGAPNVPNSIMALDVAMRIYGDHQVETRHIGTLHGMGIHEARATGPQVDGHTPEDYYFCIPCKRR